MQNLNDYVERLVAEKGFDEKDPEVIAQIKADLLERVENRIDGMIASSIDPEQYPEFEKILDTGSTEEIQAYIAKAVPDIEEKVANELLAFRSTYLS